MADKPILFSGPMVRALLDGRKTQTRRVLKPQFPDWVDSAGFTIFTPPGHISGHGRYKDHGPAEKFVKLPINKGDRLYVREAWRACSQLDHIPPRKLSPFEPRIYCADMALVEPTCAMVSAGKFRQGMHMPRWASRLTLTVTNVRVQRVQDISEADAWAEGCKEPTTPNCFASRDQFKDLWDSLNAKRGFGWDKNPWVVAYTFTVEKRNIDQ